LRIGASPCDAQEEKINVIRRFGFCSLVTLASLICGYILELPPQMTQLPSWTHSLFTLQGISNHQIAQRRVGCVMLSEAKHLWFVSAALVESTH
jgi:hypothetical protein